MRAFLALPPIRAEPGEIEFADGFSDMFLGAPGTERAETFVVMGARRKFGRRVDM